MEQNDIIATPEVHSAELLYKEWLKTSAGSRSSFFKFITTASTARDEFLTSFNTGGVFIGDVYVPQVCVK